jgi:hypothetical protein
MTHHMEFDHHMLLAYKGILALSVWLVWKECGGKSMLPSFPETPIDQWKLNALYVSQTVLKRLGIWGDKGIKQTKGVSDFSLFHCNAFILVLLLIV